jgi:predicted transcriptional regulator
LHPNAYLTHVRNVSSGVKARTKILETLEREPLDAVKTAKDTSLSYSVVMHHLRLLENEGIVQRKGRRPYYWVSTGLGQKSL